MNSSPPADGGDEDAHSSSPLNLMISKLDVYKHERLGYTDMPIAKPNPRRRNKRVVSFLHATYRWALAHL